jgi:hypothetical protein
MEMHKTWNFRVKEEIRKKNLELNDNFIKMSDFLTQKDAINLGAYTNIFRENTTIHVSQQLSTHLADLAEVFENFQGKYYKQKTRELKKAQVIPKYSKRLTELRRGVLCSLCNWENHEHFNLESLTVTYSEDFCTAIEEDFLPFLKIKFNEYFKIFLVLDEWFEITIGKGIFGEEDKAKFRRYVQIIDKCDKKKNISDCFEFCREFNTNKFSALFDAEGEKEMMKRFYKDFRKLKNLVENNPEEIFKNFPTIREWEKKDILVFRNKKSVLSDRIILDPAYLLLDKNEKYPLHFKHLQTNNFLKKQDEVSPIQIESMDASLDGRALFILISEPSDVAKFLITFDKKGVNVFKDSDIVYFDARTDQLLGLLHNNIKDHHKLSEVMEEDVKKVLEPVTIVFVKNWNEDHSLPFKRFLYKKSVMKNKMGFSHRGVFGRLTNYFSNQVAKAKVNMGG